MPRSGEQTKTQILNAAHDLVMGHSLSGISIDKVLAKAQVTKGAFFYHFKTKADLAFALVQRYAEHDQAHLEGNLARAEKLSRDPLQQILILIGLFQEDIEKIANSNIGCLVASCAYQFEELDVRVRDISVQLFLVWRQILGAKFSDVIAQYPPRLPVNAEELADGMLSTFEGGFIMMRVFQDPYLIIQQLAHYRNYIELLFSTTLPDASLTENSLQ